MRRYDLDNLRVLLFLLLIVYHVGMFFCPWSFHFKNNETVGWLVYPMLFLNQWRLPLLFVISGMGTAFALRKRSMREFVKERNRRLLLPFLFGMFFIVPPQVYLERIVKSQFTGSYIAYLSDSAFTGAYPEGNLSWHHLWFILYLLIFSMVLAPLFIYLRNRPNARFMKRLRKLMTSPIGIVAIAAPLLLTEFLLKPYFPSTHGLMNDYYNLIHYSLFYLSGFVLILLGDEIKEKISSTRKQSLLLGSITFISLLLFFQIPETVSSAPMNSLRSILIPVVTVLNIWCWILVCLGYASACLNKNTGLTTYANESVYPLYILHQTVMLVIGFLIYDLSWNVYLKIGVMIAGTFGVSLFFYEFGIRRFGLLRPLFGLKRMDKHKDRLPESSEIKIL